MKKLKNIRELRVKLKLSQESFGHKLGVSQAAISRWECGMILPSVAHGYRMSKLAAKLGYKISNSHFRK